MSILSEMKVLEIETQVFQNLVVFKKEIANPLLMKKEMDKLIKRLGKYGHKHCHKVITKVIERNEEKKTITLQIMVLIEDATNIKAFLDVYDQYTFVYKYILKDSICISISNNMEDFKRAVGKFVEYADALTVNELDFKKNHIIEIAKVDMNGTVIGFDLYMEKI